MASAFYDAGTYGIIHRDIDFASDTIKVMLVQSSYSFSATTSSMTTPASSELSVSGYSGGFSGSGRKTLASKTITNDTTNHRTTLDAADPSTYSALASGQTIGGAIVYKHITDDATSTPICFLDFTDTATNGGDFTLAYAAAGIGYFQN